MLFFASQAAALFAILFFAACAGAVLLGRREPLAVVCAAGFALLAHLLFGLAAVGMLNRTMLLVVGALVVVVGGPRLWGVRLKIHWSAVAIVPVFLLAATPPVEFDETLYHLPLIRALAESGTLAFRSELRFPLFPLMQELLSVPVLMFAGDVATHMLSLAEGVVTVALLIEWGRRRGTPAGVLAAAAFAGGPVIVHLATSGYVEMGLTLFVTAGFYCLDRRGIAAAALFLATACGVKYLAWYPVGAAGLWILCFLRPRVRNAALFTALFVAAALPTYAWILWQSGDPFFPFVRPGPWMVWGTEGAKGRTLIGRVIAFVRIPWDVTFARHRLNHQPPFTPLFAVALAALAAGAWRDRHVRLVALLTLGYLVIFVILPSDSRYLVSLLPVLFFVAASVICARVGETGIRSALFPWIVALALIPGPAYAVYRLVRHGFPPSDAAGRVAYVERRLPEVRALRLAGKGSVFACGAEELEDFAGGEYYGDFYGPDTFESVKADYALVSRRRCPDWKPGAPYVLVYRDAAAELWRRVESAP